MSDVRLDFRNVGSDWERAHRLMEVLPQMGSLDTINITLNPVEGLVGGRWLDILEENGFNYHLGATTDERQLFARRVH